MSFSTFWSPHPELQHILACPALASPPRLSRKPTLCCWLGRLLSAGFRMDWREGEGEDTLSGLGRPLPILWRERPPRLSWKGEVVVDLSSSSALDREGVTGLK